MNKTGKREKRTSVLEQKFQEKVKTVIDKYEDIVADLRAKVSKLSESEMVQKNNRKSKMRDITKR